MELGAFGYVINVCAKSNERSRGGGAKDKAGVERIAGRNSRMLGSESMHVGTTQVSWQNRAPNRFHRPSWSIILCGVMLPCTHWMDLRTDTCLDMETVLWYHNAIENDRS